MIRAVLLDRDGTLVVDTWDKTAEPIPMPSAARAIAKLRARGIKIGVVTNQPQLALGAAAQMQLRIANHRIEAVLGRMDGWFVCPHAIEAGCDCRKPAPGLVHQAMRRFGVTPQQCLVIGDIGSDVDAACNAGAAAILVPTPITRVDEIRRAPNVCENLDEAADLVLSGTAA